MGVVWCGGVWWGGVGYGAVCANTRIVNALAGGDAGGTYSARKKFNWRAEEDALVSRALGEWGCGGGYGMWRGGAV